MTQPRAQTSTSAEPAAGAGRAATAGIIGGSGYTGALLAELLLRHPSVTLTHVSSETLAGEPVARHLPRIRTGLSFCKESEIEGVDVAFVCTPHGEAARVARRLLDQGARVVDLCADFRLDRRYVQRSGTASTRTPTCCRASTASPSSTATRSPRRTSSPTPAAIPRRPFSR